MNELDISSLYGQIQAVGANKNYENYKTSAETAVQNLRVSVDITGKSTVYLDGKPVGESVTNYQSEQARITGKG